MPSGFDTISHEVSGILAWIKSYLSKVAQLSQVKNNIDIGIPQVGLLFLLYINVFLTFSSWYADDSNCLYFKGVYAALLPPGSVVS